MANTTPAQPTPWTALLERQPLVAVGLGILAGMVLARLVRR
jgi:hypothetical protein